jgi:hypothetical protein
MKEELKEGGEKLKRIKLKCVGKQNHSSFT